MQLLIRCANFVNSFLNSNNSILKLLSSLALQSSGSQLTNNCNLSKSVYRIDSNGIVTSSSTICRHIAHNVYFAGIDVEPFERAGLLREVLCEKDRDKTGDTQFKNFFIELLGAH